MEDLTIKHKDAIVNCDDCSGTGQERFFTNKQCTGKPELKTCRRCLGKGKLLKIELTILRRI